MFDFLNNNLLIICPNCYQEAILKYLSEHKKILNIKFMTMAEYIKKVKFDYDENTISFLVNTGMKVENAITILDNLQYIEEKEYSNEKLDYLVKIKRELDNNNLLIYDKLFDKILQRFKIVVYGYGKLEKWNLSLLNNPLVINYEKKHDNYEVYYIKNIGDEVEFVFQRIVELLSNGVDINKICLMNIDSEYYSLLKRYSIYYDIPLDLVNDDNIMGTALGNIFYEMICQNRNFEEIKEWLDHYQDNDLYSVLVNILNKYLLIEDKEPLIKYDLLNTKVSNKKYENVVKVKKVFDYVDDDEYVFLMGFNNSSIPKLSQDIDYITDNIKDLVGLDKTIDLNKISKENTIKYLSSINHLVISYKEVSSFNKYYPSILLDEMQYELKTYQRSFNVSNLANKNLYTMYLDDYVKYGIKNNNIDMLYHNYGENEYLRYHNVFSGIDKSSLIDYLDNSLTLSYSSIDNYYKCGFKYYLSNILKVDLFEETFMTIIGSLFHDVLRHMNDDDFDLDTRYYSYISNYTFNNKEKFFLEKLKKDLVYVIEVLKKHQFITGFNKMLYEEKIDIELKKSPYVHFKGFVDKIMYKERNGENLVSIIDYKTGNPDINIDNLEFGLSMQLPIYLYLVKNSNLLSNIQFTGFYLQHILNVDIKKGKKSVLEQKNNNLKLVGYSSDDISRIETFDSTYENSEMIKGMKVNKDGTLASSAHAISDREVENILKLTEKKIIMAMNNILEGNFAINPKIIKGKNESCTFCKFKDICYMEERNKIYLTSDQEITNDEE